MKVGIFYGSVNGNTEAVAKEISVQLLSSFEVSLYDIASADIKDMENFDLVLLGSSTWGFGEIQDDWVGKEGLDGIDLSGKKVAVFGTGDQEGFSDTFVDAIGILAESAKNAGGMLIGSWSVEGYEFDDSRALVGDKLVGLAIDEDNQSAATSERISSWVSQIKKEAV